MEIGRGFEAQENRSLFQTIHKGKMNKEAEKSQGNRKIFQTLQCSAQDPQKLAGQAPVSKKPISKLVPSKEPLSKHVYKDPKIVKTFDHKAVQTERNKRLGSQSLLSEDIDQEAYDLMVSEEVPESYWKELAEQRRMALNDSLHENEMLHKEVEELREENSKLSEMAEKADYFADVIQTMIGGEEEQEKNEKPDEEQENQELDEEQPSSGKEKDTPSSGEEQCLSESDESETPEAQTKDVNK
ncbi:geminin-like isoform X1 [Crassostrea angulata]|uniref:geminin-like isoform X1 n=1 Tax=Magallana angulata TaxID=2784310 RepID=UPI0022B1E6A2|nr:geminin-like isoform X1 [Crassostrea angulata]